MRSRFQDRPVLLEVIRWLTFEAEMNAYHTAAESMSRSYRNSFNRTLGSMSPSINK